MMGNFYLLELFQGSFYNAHYDIEIPVLRGHQTPEANEVYHQMIMFRRGP